ncbi:MAG: hypothetical protein A3I12_01050 [Gammaproteobacteria bacterium RIFCSPLOWO2_02_FULL_38_11]|nr:MAG: hypothetical protein A3B69_02410 [Gammaproteobacteria bacterium RIFCSPHIGHO2_02_FULL_38_33]OGT23801.1 MAG: hypothetical protein A2W47_07370 [Gammaproteobacteria bacterium RIFCSPHIGHO2_12_38_15]OGT68887.1 MAG: hypothetical protein A3I12_01050 [Gammaproteobacteria bacterium RIFCSPLOWO2_02_FULL_38_11]OGT76792.1 MAG: hypothetical protein A3G71_00525 [Gammaproteobacteria bacterium RIFCSPLOWO2_12_FULL_38_14]
MTLFSFLKMVPVMSAANYRISLFLDLRAYRRLIQATFKSEIIKTNTTMKRQHVKSFYFLAQ